MGPVGRAVVGIGICGTTMIGAFGGPCPVPSCAIATLPPVDAMANSVTIVNLILVLLVCGGAAPGMRVCDPSATSRGVASMRGMPHQGSVAGDARLSLP